MQMWLPKDLAASVKKAAAERHLSVKVFVQLALSKALEDHAAAKVRKAAVERQAELKAASTAQYAIDGEALF
jgi:hypothetical protein